jgi:hypothetical protein
MGWALFIQSETAALMAACFASGNLRVSVARLNPISCTKRSLVGRTPLYFNLAATFAQAKKPR